MTPKEAIEKLYQAESRLQAARSEPYRFKKRVLDNKDKINGPIFKQENARRLQEAIRGRLIERFRAFTAAVNVFLKLPNDQLNDLTKSSDALVRRVAKEALSDYPLHTAVTCQVPTGMYLAAKDSGIMDHMFSQILIDALNPPKPTKEDK